jgi:zinc protease
VTPGGGAEAKWDGSPEHLVDALRVETLANGLRVATLPANGSDLSVRLAVRYGSNTLLAGRWAAAQIFSLILKNGPADMTPAAFSELKTRLQFDMGTSFSVGDLVININNATRDDLDQILRLLNHTIRNPRLDSASIAKARQERELSARALERTPILLARNTLQRRLWQLPESHPLYDATGAERDATSKSVPDTEVAKIHQELWSPGNMLLVVVGDFARETVHRTARDVFGDWNKSAPLAEVLSAPYVETRPEHIAVPLSGLKEALMVAGLLVPLGRDSADLSAMRVAAHIIGSGATTSRLGARIREQAGLSYTVHASLESPRGAASLFIIRANAAPEGLHRVEELARAELAAILREGFSEEEVARAKEGMANAWRGFVGQPRQVVRLLVDLLSTGRTFSDELAGQRRLSAVTADGASQAARTYLDPARLVVVRVGADVR